MAIKWVDRVPTYANRVRIVPENGSAPYYATMERADQPTVVGTPINAANLNAMQEASGLTASRTVYVATTGSDATGNGSQTAPYATINKALSTIPKNLNGFTATINIAAGTYDENVSVTNFGNGFLKFSGNDGDMITVTRFEILNVKLAEITEISLTIPNSYFYVLASGVRVATNIIANGGVYGVYATNGSTLVCAGTVEVNNTTNYAIVTTSGSRCFIQNIIGTNNKVMAASTLGGIFTYGTSTLSSTSQFYTDTGGRVFSGAQTNAPVN
jgi:hypothetical protein